MSNIFVYLFQILIFYFYLPIVLLAFILKFTKNQKTLPKPLLVFTSFGIGPGIISIIVYYLLFFLPKYSSCFYVIILLIIIFIITIITNSYIKESVYLIIGLVKNTNKIILILLFIILSFWQIIVFTIPILGHDTYEYANQGKIFFNNKQITYSKHQFDQNTNFYYVGRHGFAYPLVATTEKFFNDIFNINKDLLFKSISGYYWILIILLQYYILSKKNKTLAIISTITLVSSFGFTIMFAFFHLDTFRIFLLLLSIICCLFSLKNNNTINLILFGITSGISGNIHSIGVILSMILFLTYFLFSKEKINHKFKNLFIVFITFLIFGGIHYLFDIIWGTGWLLF
ncbi:MAG: glycosyltransferase family 39 protein [Candidatus Shapirobacteria bacterium]|nr:glycosyltransferase family 39 protein [Candidatus Shapirobacteria bacterium]MDD3002708.1 glycosyltransferase family 39 protein [Candidatus Shapirobacteria bacterium]MDD4383213.1 glycosyltransferase family 39 protein [Candidatus Shapirobacteria bacterium]